MKTPKRQSRFRLAIQLLAAAITNGYAAGFLKGGIFTGKSKSVCVPVLNCYSCPAALGSCPIGALQAVAAGGRHQISFYVLGTLMLFGTLLGRLICGFLCPFGLVQDLLHRIPLPKLTVPRTLDRILRFLKYGILGGFVLLLPAFVSNAYGIGEPWFCKYICPAGTLGGGIPLLLMNDQLRSQAGGLFFWKLCILIAVAIGAVFISRCFCRYLCPLGAFYALFNKFSFYQMELDQKNCIDCGKCESVCPMAVDVRQNINSAECIRCGKCKSICPADAIRSGIILSPVKSEPKEET